MTKVIAESSVVIAGSECPEVVAACKMIPAATLEETLELACDKLGPDCDILNVPHALLILNRDCVKHHKEKLENGATDHSNPCCFSYSSL